MPGILLPKPVSVAQFVPPAGEPSYSQIFADTMGNLGTPSDGFDLLLSSMVSLTDGIAPISDLDPTDLQQVSDISQQFGTSFEGGLALSLQPAGSATDAALLDYSGVALPNPQPTTPAGPPPTQPPAASTATCGPFAAGTQVTVLPAMKLGAAQDVSNFDEEQRVTGDPQTIRATLNCGDPAIFSVKGVSTFAPNIGAGSETIVTLWNLYVTPSKAGTFYAIVDDVDNSSGSQDHTFFNYQVTIS